MIDDATAFLEGNTAEVRASFRERLATPEEIAALPGFSSRSAARILEHLRS